MLLSLKRYFNKHFNRGDDDNEDDEELGQVVANDLKFFNLLEAEMQGLTKIFTSLHFVVGSHDALIKVKSRVRVAKDNEKVAEVDKDEEMAAEALLESDLEVVKRTTVSSIIKNLELLLGKLELERKQSLSSYRFLKNDDASGECTICYDDLGASDLVILPCNHKFHYNCHLEWEKRSDAPQCAMCRAPAPKNELQRVRDNSIQVKKRVESENSKPVDPIMSSLRLEGMSAKLAAVVKELKSCAAWNEPARIVLFSQFAEMLPVIYNACTVNGLHEFICYGKTAAQLSKSIDVFKSRCKKERFVVLLLPISKVCFFFFFLKKKENGETRTHVEHNKGRRGFDSHGSKCGFSSRTNFSCRARAASGCKASQLLLFFFPKKKNALTYKQQN
jgi:SNF2 family DNA or RNA helicase